MNSIMGKALLSAVLSVWIAFASVLCSCNYSLKGFPDQSNVVEIKQGEKQVFKVYGTINSDRSRCQWILGNRKKFNSPIVGNSEFEFYDPEGLMGNKPYVMCGYQKYVYGFNGDMGAIRLGWHWETVATARWNARIIPDSVPVYKGDYEITSAGDMELLKDYTTITGTLNVFDVNEFEDLSGLVDLTVIGGDLNIESTDTLKNLSGLENLTSLGGNLVVQFNDSLTNLSCLENLFDDQASINGSLIISNNIILTSLSALKNVTSVGEDLTVCRNDVLTSLSDLENIISIGKDLYICSNYTLAVLGMTFLNRVGRDFEITGNTELCSILVYGFMDQVLAGDGIGRDIIINGNKNCAAP